MTAPERGEEEAIMGRFARGVGPLLCGALLALHAGVARAAGETAPAADGRVLTGKERLSGKGADEQRVDNCKVSADRRGPKERPDHCGETGAAATR